MSKAIMNIREKKHRLDPSAYIGEVTVAVTACILNRRTAFVNEAIVSEFLGILTRSSTKLDCSVLIYCFMPDHLHLVVQGKSEHSNILGFLRDFKQRTGFWLPGHFPDFEWQKDFYDHIIRADEDLARQIRYVAENPVRRGLVTNWRDYPHTGSIGFDLLSVLQDVAND